MKPFVPITAGRLAVSLLIPFALISMTGCRDANQFVAPPPPQVTVAHPQQLDTTYYLTFPGRTAASDEVDIRARVRGYLDSVEFQDGDLVKAGETLFLIEKEIYTAQVEAAEAELGQAKANQQLADAKLQRIQKAFETKAVSELDVLEAEAQLAVAQGQVAGAQAALAASKLDLDYTTVTTPVAGRTARRYVSAGNLVGSGESTLLTRVVVEDPLYVYFNVDERSALRLLGFDDGKPSASNAARRTQVEIELADGTIWPDMATIDYNDPDFDPDTGTISVRATLPNPAAKLNPGMFARIRIPVPRNNVVIVPDTALQRDMIGPYLLIVDAAGMVTASHVELGADVKEGRIIRKGVTAADRIIVEGLQRARPGITVAAVEAPPPAAVPEPEPAAASAEQAPTPAS
jgi:RND family efflux transporter MFP subunit